MFSLFTGVLTVKTVLGLLGAIPGGLRAYVLARAKHSRARAMSDVAIGCVFAASVSEIMTPDAYPSTALLVGLFAGLAGGRALDALFELVPEVVRTLALGWARKMVGEQGEQKLREASGWGDLAEPKHPHDREI